MVITVLVSERSPLEALPALEELAIDVKVEPLSTASLPHVLSLRPEVVLVDAAENPGQGHHVMLALREAARRVPTIAVVERRDLERFGWDEVCDELVYPAAPAPELRLRLEMLRRRRGAAEGNLVRVGPLALDPGSYRVTLSGRALDLTYKEFELLRYLAQRAGRVCTRPTLLREVWGFDFYGGTRTVDVHVRRLRAKLGPEHEHLVETVRGVGYRMAESEGPDVVAR
jgi:DNA-binding response OmpR family regulator